MDDLPMSVKHTATGQESHFELSGFIMVEEAKKIIEEDWIEITKTADTDPQPFDHDAFRYIEPEEDVLMFLPSINKCLKAEIKKLYD